ncbi:MAG: ABC transporter permease [Bacilli bacterium]|nr:ABC transporter permease [Bacilli bacterium]
MKSNKKKEAKKTRRFFSVFGIPYAVFLILFIIIPILIIVYYAFTENGQFSISAAASFFTSWAKWKVLLISMFVALQTTIICLLIGYPLAYFLANKKFNKNTVLVTLFIAPMWINFVLRTGATRDLLTWIGVKGGRMPYFATLVGMVYNYLPFVILPLYSTMLKLDKSLMEAASDLGANPFQVFIKALAPQTIPGIVSATLMTFMPTMSSYVISDVLSENMITLFGNYINTEFGLGSWNTASFMAMIMLLIVGISLFINLKFNKDKEGGRTQLW